MRVVYRPWAQADIYEAIAWYEERQDGLGDRFFGAVLEAVDGLDPFVERGVQVEQLEVRRVPVAGFPYGIFYRVKGEFLYVEAVFHDRRDPKRRAGR